LKTRALQEAATENMIGTKKLPLAGNAAKLNDSRLSFGPLTGSARIQTAIGNPGVHRNPQNIQPKITKSDRAANVLSLAIVLAAIKMRRKMML
jgi:hypothetical protein